MSRRSNDASLIHHAGATGLKDGATATRDFARLPLAECLNQDHRPTFVFNQLTQLNEEALVFCNDSLIGSARLHELVDRIFHSSSPPQKQDDAAQAFRSWIIMSSARTTSLQGYSKVFLDTLWAVTVVEEQWVVVSGVELSKSDLRTSIAAHPSHEENVHENTPMGDLATRTSMKADTTSKLSTLSAIQAPVELGGKWPPSGIPASEHLTFIRQFDWASTPLGPIEAWSSQLRQACEMMLVNPDPVTIFWGEELIMIYNEAYIAVAGNKHPTLMGGSARMHWREVWDQYDPLFDQIRKDGLAFKQENSQLFIYRRGYLEEGFFNLIVMPVLGEDGSVVGFYEPVAEVTKQTLWERRMQMLLHVGESISPAASLKDLWQRLLNAVSGHESDVHFAVLYSRQEELEFNTQMHPYHFEGACGFREDHLAFRASLNTLDGDTGFETPFRPAHCNGSSILLQTQDGSLTEKMLRRLDNCGIKEPVRDVVVCPLSSSVDEEKEAYLSIGISPKRHYDDDYRLFIQLLVRQVESTITFVKLFEKEKIRLREQAAYESELRFKLFAERAPVGIFNFDAVGNIRFCNQAWLDISGHDRNAISSMPWAADVHPDNAAECKGYWDKIVNLEGPQTFEVQYKKHWKPAGGGNDIALDRTWVVASAYAEVDDEGVLTGILGCVTDISHQKWADQIQSQRLSEALELKRQQENFLDITSHEMRNPLNAILHCAGELIEVLTRLSGNAAPSEDEVSVLSECLEVSRTIAYCGRHQKRIIDDVLTLSKLDSNLLSIAPLETRPLDVVDEVLKVFDTELRASKIQTQTELGESYHMQGMASVLIDPHRVVQILINLVANAIKFTKGESLRSLHIAISAFSDEPSSRVNGVRYIPSGRHRKDPTQQAEWGEGDVVFLHFSVQDTGPGMTQQEADLLFNRFAQGSPRTHVQYGGSGLGLFISRELAELHGGRIGISSEPGLGSTFDFYVKGRRTTLAPFRKPTTESTSTRRILQKSPRDSNSSDVVAPQIHEMKSSPNILQKVSPMPKIHVLIVEDNLVNQRILSKIMRKQGYAVSIANHGEEALAIIQASTWYCSSATGTRLDIVLCDIEMPVMDGKECVKKIREWQKQGLLCADVPVIAVTGNARSEQMRAAKETGFDDVVPKPYLVDDLVKRIEHFTQRPA